MVNALEFEGHTKMMHHYQGSMVGGPPHFGEINWLHQFW